MAVKLFQKLITAIYPDRCLFCGKVTSPGQLCCSDCNNTLPFLNSCGVTLRKDEPFSWVAVPFSYENGVRKAIIQMKFYGHKEAAQFFVPYMLKSLNGFLPDVVVPVPMAEHRRKERGFNQAELLAKPIAEALQAEYSSTILLRTDSIVQHDLSARQRKQESNQSFVYTGNASLLGKRILLVDDIVTTGSTLRRCARLLKEAGAAEVVCAAAAATPQKRKA